MLRRRLNQKCGSFSNKAAPSFTVVLEPVLSLCVSPGYSLFPHDIFPNLLLQLDLGLPHGHLPFCFIFETFLGFYLPPLEYLYHRIVIY
jgi:hypothetical protein